MDGVELCSEDGVYKSAMIDLFTFSFGGLYIEAKHRCILLSLLDRR